MRSFFNKPSWASRGDEQADLNFYRHAGQVYNDIITAYQKARAGRLSAEKDSPKRRCLPSRHSPDNSISKPINNGEVSRSAEQSPNIEAGCCDDFEEKNNSNSHQSRTTSIGISGTTTIEADIQSCESSTDMKLIHIETPAAGSQLAGGVKEKTKAPIKGSHRQNPQELNETPMSHNHRLAHNEAIVQILITSKITNTKPLIVRRRMHQPLKDVRLAWCNRQQFSKEMQASVFLTWKGKRLFDVTTCRSLGIQTDRGIFVGMKEYDPFQVDGENVQVHMEAATEESLSNNLRHSPTVTDTESTFEPAGLTEGSSSADKVTLKCPTFGDLKVTLSLDMQVSQLVVDFRDAKKIPAGCEVFLVFDGDRLDPLSSLADYELINDDLVDVIIK
ncbi:hypothetical protein BO94DRAFT_356409 [Aspergillus sclerotioniger CBS 115572]|uniref:Rad60/SUMO-like domain-containing protein n=1 Tax=Aspergillus sclerotioniger CBS 115572 TaxID=1450535 RepID=A0A317UYF6_9EURO|nr:hypothetical protein BO94DRAFT_356409 [Aspergillus sclerotioniger CBS 115572]PWY65020.1 hypothetical protein BO94DRAFT_356409 [Aspergillus sclerotioniger CBS 115572]